MTAPPSSKPRNGPLIGLAVAALAVLAYRGYAPRFQTQPLDAIPTAANRLDLNAADRAELLQVPGIGTALADAILSHRGDGKRFGRVEDLAAVKGIGPKTLDKLRPWLRVEVPLARGQAPEVETLERKPAKEPVAAGLAKKFQAGDAPIDVNAATAEDLQRLPGVGAMLAARIMAERDKAKFTKVDELRRVPGIGAKTLEKLRPCACVKP